MANKGKIKKKLFNIKKIRSFAQPNEPRFNVVFYRPTWWQQNAASMETAEVIKSVRKSGNNLVDTDTCFIINTYLDRANKKLL